MKKVFTEKEIIVALERQAFLVEQKINKQVVNIKELNNSLSGEMVINLLDLHTKELIYLSDKSLEKLNIPPDIFTEKPIAVVKECMFPGDFEKGNKLLKHHLSSSSRELPISYIQRTKPYKKDSADYTGMFTVTKHNSKIGQLSNIVIPLKELGIASLKMLRALEETLYMRNNYHKFASLTARKKEIITLLALGYQNNEIGEQLFISKAMVEQHRKNLKRKLEIKRFVDLIRFAQAFDLI